MSKEKRQRIIKVIQRGPLKSLRDTAAVKSTSGCIQMGRASDRERPSVMPKTASGQVIIPQRDGTWRI